MTTNWSCAQCGVVASFASQGQAKPQPVGWTRRGSGWLCLGCRRREVMDRASLPGEGKSGGLRRKALVEFELIRDPAASDLQVARRARCSTSYVAPVRKLLGSARERRGRELNHG